MFALPLWIISLKKVQCQISKFVILSIYFPRSTIKLFLKTILTRSHWEYRGFLHWHIGQKCLYCFAIIKASLIQTSGVLIVSIDFSDSMTKEFILIENSISLSIPYYAIYIYIYIYIWKNIIVLIHNRNKQKQALILQCVLWNMFLVCLNK